MNVLVVAAHPDDEMLGCGGALARHSSEGDEVSILILAEGVTSRDETRDVASRVDELMELKRASREAAAIVGAGTPQFGGLPDNRLDTVPLLEVAKLVETAVSEFSPHVVYTHHGGDLNVDHRITHQAVMTACRPIEHSGVRNVYAFEVASSTEWSVPTVGSPFIPNHFVDIDTFLDVKVRALRCYEAEMRPFPHPRSYAHVENLARVRGASSGLKAAEGFMVMRQVVS
jgi:LmbE family N-acetylglucosaminyl deacetylase